MTSKKLILAGIIALIMSGAALKVSAQVGINTDDPKATLDIVGKPSDATMADGFIAPRLTGDQLKAKDAAYSTAQTGAVVYATNAVGTASAKTVNVTAAGYYYFDGSVWQSLKGTGGVSPSDFSFTYNPTTNVLTLNDGTNSTVINLVAGASNGLTSNNGNVQLGGNLTQNTTIDNGSNGLTLGSSTSTGDVTVYNLKVPGAKDITSGATSNASATVPLNVTGGAGQVINSMNAVLTVNNTAPLWNANQIQGKTISGTPSTTNNTLVYNGTNFTYSTANSALVKKDIEAEASSATATAPLTITNGAGQIVGASNAKLAVNNTAPLWNANKINGTTVSGTPAAGKVLTINTGGNAEWQTPSTSSTFVVSPEITGNYVVTNESYLKLNLNAMGYTLTLPTGSDVPVGRVIYASNIGNCLIDLIPKPRNMSYPSIIAGGSCALVYLGGTGNGSWDMVTGY